MRAAAARSSAAALRATVLQQVRVSVAATSSNSGWTFGVPALFERRCSATTTSKQATHPDKDVVTDRVVSGAKNMEKVDPVKVTSKVLYSPSPFTAADVNKFYTLSSEDLDQYFGEGLPSGLVKEFQETKESSVLIRAQLVQLCDRFKKSLADSLRIREQIELEENVRTFASKPRQCLLEGFVKGGKSVALAMLVLWARMQGWLVFYVPNGREWTSVGMYYKNTETGLWDTPLQAKTVLEGFLRSHSTRLEDIPCRIMKPLLLGEGAGTGKARGPQEVTLREGATLRDLVEKGLSQSQAGVSAVVRLREEFNLVQEVPVLIAIDEFNSWFTFSGYHESTGTRSRRPIHARELSMVNAFRPMEGPLMMATAFSQSMAVGKLPVQLPGVPKGVRFTIKRYNLAEARSTLNYYFSRKVTSKEPTEEDVRKLFFLTNGNGDELRNLVRLL